MCGVQSAMAGGWGMCTSRGKGTRCALQLPQLLSGMGRELAASG